MSETSWQSRLRETSLNPTAINKQKPEKIG